MDWVPTSCCDKIDKKKISDYSWFRSGIGIGGFSLQVKKTKPGARADGDR